MHNMKGMNWGGHDDFPFFDKRKCELHYTMTHMFSPKHFTKFGMLTTKAQKNRMRRRKEEVRATLQPTIYNQPSEAIQEN